MEALQAIAFEDRCHETGTRLLEPEASFRPWVRGHEATPSGNARDDRRRMSTL